MDGHYEAKQREYEITGPEKEFVKNDQPAEEAE